MSTRKAVFFALGVLAAALVMLAVGLSIGDAGPDARILLVLLAQVPA